jgi:TatD DNase family protein
MEHFVDIHTHNPRTDVISPTMAGIHPWDAERELALPDFTECDIIGETGLDYAHPISKTLQKELSCKHLDMAQTLGKPIVLHVVRAMEDVLKIIDHYKEIKGVVFHGFIGSKEQAYECLKRGYFLSFGERSLRSPKSVEALRITPLSQLFCETDDNAPTRIEHIYNEVAKIKEITPEELLKNIEENYKNLFHR